MILKVTKKDWLGHDLHIAGDNLESAGHNLKSIDDLNSKREDWPEMILGFLSKMFIYSLFFACWLWSLKNYKAHWHAYLSNEYRCTALNCLTRLRTDKKVGAYPELRKQVLLKEIELLGSIPLSGYLDKEQEKTAAEKILWLEEKMVEALTTPHK